MNRWIKISAITFSVFMLISASGLAFLYYRLPALKDAPKAPVLAMPSGSDNYPANAYQGPHPLEQRRPTETFPFPIKIGQQGPTQPLFSGLNQYPFYCGKNRITQQQPSVDNHDGIGVPVFSDNISTENIIGYSMDCSHPSTAHYFYKSKQHKSLVALTDDVNEQDIEIISLSGKQIPFVVRLEVGTINRFFYLIAALRGHEKEQPEQPSTQNWNKRLIYLFKGGVGIGHRQGNISSSTLLSSHEDQLKQGYALVYSTGNRTSNHYNMWLAEDVAARVKKQFVSRYAEPDFSIGFGGSGGAIQQYLIAQNHPGLLDGIIPAYSYPDMITQTTHVFDCEPLEFYFDVLAENNPKWSVWENRQLIEGMNASSTIRNRFAPINQLAEVFRGKIPSSGQGSSECIQGWRGLTPLVHNPQFSHITPKFSPQVVSKVRWSHWYDLKDIYGLDAQGFANSPWDNEGVQYGLQALLNKDITPEEFLDVNSRIGGWKSGANMRQEKFWLMLGDMFPFKLFPWSQHNMTHGGNSMQIAERSVGNLGAMRAAYHSGQAFIGFANLPIIDMRHYLDNELNMHHLTASFSSRQRLLDGQGFADNQKIWVSHKDYNPLNEAIETMDKWLTNYQQNPEAGYSAAQPKSADDKCIAANGDILATGDKVWDGSWNQSPRGSCSKIYHRFPTSREVAGDSVAGLTFKCALQPVAKALASGIYGSEMDSYQEPLEAIFPRGVCDYKQRDLALPEGLLVSLRSQNMTKQLFAADKPKVITNNENNSVSIQTKSQKQLQLSLLE